MTDSEVARGVAYGFQFGIVMFDNGRDQIRYCRDLQTEAIITKVGLVAPKGSMLDQFDRDL